MDETRQGELIDEAWNILGQLVEKGSAQLKNGRTVAPDDEALVRHFQWLANHKKPRKKLGALPEDWQAAQTSQRREGKDGA